MNIIEKNKKLLIWLILLVLMCFSFTYQRVYVDPSFQCDSETLVSGVIRGEREGAYTSEYGLGRYYNIAGHMASYSGESLLYDETTVEGYVIGSNILKLIKNAYTNIIKDAQYITFENGDSFVISEVSEKDNCYYFKVDSTYQIGLDKNGSLVNAKFFDENMNEYQKFFIDEYVSQYGLQGKVFSTIAKIINYHGWKKIELLLTVFLTASVLIAICYFVSLKYNCILSFCFYIVFLLSPWIRNFSSNLYWVEFTWFSPMLLGLIVSIFCNNNKKIIIFGLFSFALIFIKSLCGYEYLSTIMLGLIMFPTSDLCISIFNKNKGKIKNDLKIIICLGLFALAGFISAIFIHSYIRGNGDILIGIETIWKQDVLRRTYGGSKDYFSEAYWASFDASTGYVLKTYFNFYTDIIKGIPGTFFKPLFFISLVFAILNILKKRKKSKEVFVLYILSFISSISWFVLAKSHSYVHTHMNYVLWYFGFIQVEIYIVLVNAIRMFRDNKNVIFNTLLKLKNKIANEIREL